MGIRMDQVVGFNLWTLALFDSQQIKAIDHTVRHFPNGEIETLPHEKFTFQK